MKQKWDEFYSKNDRFYLLPHPELDNAIQRFNTVDAFKIIDLGCGSGINLVELASQNFHVTGIDFSPSAARLAEEWLAEKGLTGNVYVADLEKGLSLFQDNEFDGCIAINSLQYIDRSENLIAVLKELSRILKPNAPLMLTLPSQNSAILQPNVTQMIWEQEELTHILTSIFTINDFHQDIYHSWVVFMSNMRDHQGTAINV